jgi:hypothetical protein
MIKEAWEEKMLRSGGKNMARNKKLPKESIEKIVERYKEGVPLKDIEEEFNVSIATIHYYVKKAGISLSRNKIHRDLDIIRLLSEPKRTCLCCGKEFIPYSYRYCVNRHVCFECWFTAKDIGEEEYEFSFYAVS